MTGGLNFARAGCAAESSAGNASSSARSKSQALSRESGSAMLLADSTAAISVFVSGGKMAMRRYFARFINSMRETIIPPNTGKDDNGRRLL
jgi:hypothetical protein